MMNDQKSEEFFDDSFLDSGWRRPADLFIGDKNRKETYGEGIRDMVTSFKTADDSLHTTGYMYNKSKDDYPELSFLFPNFEEMYLRSAEDPSARSVFDRFEAALESVENAYLNCDKSTVEKEMYLLYKKVRPMNFYEFSNKDFLEENGYTVEDITATWFMGGMDNSSGISTHNHLEFKEYIEHCVDCQRTIDAEYSAIQDAECSAQEPDCDR